MKKKILMELNKEGFPDLKLIYSSKALDFALEILWEELDKEKKDFEDFLKIENKDLKFDDFMDEWILNYYWRLLNHLESIDSNKKVRKIIEKFMPKLIDFSNYISYNKKYYEKLLYIDNNLDLDEEQKRIIFLRIKDFKDRWIDLAEEKQKRIKIINKKLSKLSESFSNNVLDEEKNFEYLITDYKLIKNLPKEVLKTAKKAWKDKGAYLFDSSSSNYSAIMKYCTSSEIRKDFEELNYKMASKWKFDNRKNILKTLELRDEKAKILWYKNFGELSLNEKMAESPEKVQELLWNIFLKALPKAEEEIETIKTHFKLKKLSSYDFPFYSRLLKEEKYKINDEELKEYFDFENTLNFLYRFTEKFYSIKIKETDIKSYNKNIRIYEIYRDNILEAYFFLDPFSRKGKSSWCWSWGIRDKEYKNFKKIPIIVNVLDIHEPTKGNTKMYIRDVESLFHEFWHAVHTMLYESKYSELGKSWIEWDFVELPSQLMENWVKEKESLEKFAINIETEEKITSELIDSLEEAKNFNVWNFLISQARLWLIDMYLHTIEPPKNITELDRLVLGQVNKYSIFKRKKDYRQYCQFSHIFDWWYSAWYYSYIWAEILEADVFEKVKELWMFSPLTWKKLYDTIIWQGVKKQAKDLFYDFMWRDFDDTAFYKRYWITK